MKKVVIIGAGPAGLTVAYELLKSGNFEIVVLEGSGEIGGISRTVKYKGGRMDIGGHRFFSKEKRVVDFWEKIMPTQGKPAIDDRKMGRGTASFAINGPDPEKEDKVMLVRDRTSSIYYDRKFFDYPVNLKLSTIRGLGIIATMSVGMSYLKTSIAKRKERNLEDLYINRFGEKLYVMFFEQYTKKVLGRHPREVSADWGGERMKGLSIMVVVGDILRKAFSKKRNSERTETSLIDEFWYPKYGPGQFWETVVEEIIKLGGKIELHAQVEEVLRRKDGSVEGVAYRKKARRVVEGGDVFISTMPMRDLIERMDGVPREIREVAEGLLYRDFVTLGLLVDRIELEKRKGMADCWIYVQDEGVKIGRIQFFNNWSPYMVEKPDSTVGIGLEYFCDEGDDFWEMSEKRLLQEAIAELVKIGVIRGEEAVLEYHREKVRKAYPAYFGAYYEVGRLRDWLAELPNLYSIGRNGQHRYSGMDDSMMMAFELADKLISG